MTSHPTHKNSIIGEGNISVSWLHQNSAFFEKEMHMRLRHVIIFFFI